MKLTDLPRMSAAQLQQRGLTYHNYFRVGYSEALAKVAASLPTGWVAAGGMQFAPNLEVPVGTVRVGQVRCHHGDPEIMLLAIPKQITPAGREALANAKEAQS
jgi:hypothetical protein